MKENKTPVAPVAEAPVEEKKYRVNCPKCGTTLYVKGGNFAHLCPVCSNVFRIRIGQKMVKDVSRTTMVEAYVNVDKNANGEVKANSVVTEK